MREWDYTQIKLCQGVWAQAQHEKPLKADESTYSLPLEEGRGPQFVPLPEDDA